MTNFTDGIILFVCATVLLVSGTVLGFYGAMHDAYQRGYAVQCIGKIGYYWECEK